MYKRQHSHTLASGHAYSTIKEMAAAAEAKGLKALALTEHAPKMPVSYTHLDVYKRQVFVPVCSIIFSV